MRFKCRAFAVPPGLYAASQQSLWYSFCSIPAKISPHFDKIKLLTIFLRFYALAIGSPQGMQTEQRGRTDAVPAARYNLPRAVS